VLLLAVAVLALSHYDSFHLGTWIDGATYVVQARALLEPDLRAWLATHPAPMTFPPGYPFFLAPLVALSPGSLLVLKLSSLAVTLLCATLLYWGWQWYAPGTSYYWASAATTLCGLSSLTIQHTRMVMSEPLFALLALLSVRSSLRLPDTRLHVGDLQARSRLVFVSEGDLPQVFRIPHG
jgi:hypothetical protein